MIERPVAEDAIENQVDANKNQQETYKAGKFFHNTGFISQYYNKKKLLKPSFNLPVINEYTKNKTLWQV
ncbi:hypothetical protein DJ568_06385 [Mucilaginibacter hurinus]|uniref:Uncharacterized protein n=1 Tax=Mucilaginibacter hurinus TaxID=2201324 RepID=A0A367GPY3_9SPHI|nr:hypothetical protein DJ568_06385 [Mucilaginibacter hurinus]